MRVEHEEWRCISIEWSVLVNHTICITYLVLDLSLTHEQILGKGAFQARDPGALGVSDNQNTPHPSCYIKLTLNIIISRY